MAGELNSLNLLVFINYLPDNIKNSVCLFADNYKCPVKDHSFTARLILQEDLDNLRLWKSNIAKCHSIRLTWHYSHKQIIHDYTLNQQTLENVQSAKYLGITITENMNYSEHISNNASKATKTWVSFAGTWLLTFALLRRLHTKLWYALNWCMQYPFGAHVVKLRFNKWRRYRGRQPAGPAGDDATLVVLVRCSMSCNGQVLEARWDQSSLLFFHKIHCGIMSIDKDKFLTPSQSTRSTRSSHNSQYCTPQTYSDAQKYSFFPKDYFPLA